MQKVVAEAIAAAADVAVHDLAEDSDVFDLGLDSIDFWSILMDVESAVGTEVPAQVLDRLAAIDDGDVTVGRLLAVVSGWAPAADLTQD